MQSTGRGDLSAVLTALSSCKISWPGMPEGPVPIQVYHLGGKHRKRKKEDARDHIQIIRTTRTWESATMPCNAVCFCHGLDSDKARRIEQVGEEVLSATTHMVVCQVFPCMSTEDIRVPLPCPGMYCYPRSSSGHTDFGHEPCQPLPRASSAPGNDARRRGMLIALRAYFDLSRRME